MLKILFFLFPVLLSANSITVAIASNVSYVIPEIIKVFNKENPSLHVKTVIGSSGKLTAMIEQNAPYDLFLSADMKYPKYLYNHNLAYNKPVVYASGCIVIFSKKQRDMKNWQKEIVSKKIKKIAMANPKTAPYGKAAFEVLNNLGLYNKVKEKLVYGSCVSHTLSYALNATDMGFVAKSALFSKKMRNFKQYKNWIDIDTKLYTPISQGLVMLKNTKKLSDSKKFYNFLLSNTSKEIFKKYGYIVK